MIRHARATDCLRQDRFFISNLFHTVLWHHRLGLQEAVTAPVVFIPTESKNVSPSHRLQHGDRRRHDLATDPIPWQHRDVIETFVILTYDRFSVQVSLSGHQRRRNSLPVWPMPYRHHCMIGLVRVDLTWIEDFLALQETANFSRAAERRHVTQPAFSRRIRALEDWAGATLFDRSSHRIGLTAAGHAFRGEATELLRRAGVARDRAREAGDGSTASVRFACTHLLSSTFFPRWLSQIELRAGCEFRFQFLVDNMIACERMMLRNDARLLLCHHHERATSELEVGAFRRIDLETDTLVPVSLPDGHGAPLHSFAGSATGPVAFLAHRPESGLARILTRSGNLDRLDDRLRPVFDAHAALTLLTMIRAGRGMSWIPLSAVAAELECGALVRAGDQNWDVPIEICLIRPKARQEESIEAFLSYVTAVQDATHLP